jgi:hypothetical protein
MTNEPEKYRQIIECEVPENQGLVFIKVIALPYQDAVEFDATQAREFAARILKAAERAEAQWGIKSSS